VADVFDLADGAGRREELKMRGNILLRLYGPEKAFLDKTGRTTLC
jgi:hypothetical protein